MHFFNKNSKCNCGEARHNFFQSDVKKYLAGFLLLFAVVLLIPNAKAQFWNSGEQYIRDAYQTYLGRAPDQNAINYYLYEMEKGRSYDSIKSEIENSQEARSYLLYNGPRITSFNAQKIDKNNNTWSFLWSTTKASQVAMRFQCVSGVKIFIANTTEVFPCDEDRRTNPNSGASFSLRNATGRGLIISVRLYPIADDKVFLSAAKTISFYIDKSLLPTAPLTPSYRPVQSTTASPTKSSQVLSKPVVIGSTKPTEPIIIGPVQSTQVSKTVSVDSLTVADSATLGKNAKRITWKITNADSVSLSLACPPKVTATLVTKANTKRSFACGDTGQKFNPSDYVDFIFSNSSKTMATVTVKLTPVVSSSAVSSKTISRSFNLAK